jgi:hypothetical protein
MRHIFDLHPAALAGELLAGRPDAGPAKRDAEPEPDTVRADGRRRILGAVLAFRRRRETVLPARSGSA